LGQYDLADSVIPAHNFVGDALEPSTMLSVQMLLRTIQNMRDPELIDATLVTQGLNGRYVKLVCDLVYGIAHWNRAQGDSKLTCYYQSDFSKRWLKANRRLLLARSPQPVHRLQPQCLPPRIQCHLSLHSRVLPDEFNSMDVLRSVREQHSA
jgi:hypothetical protein